MNTKIIIDIIREASHTLEFVSWKQTCVKSVMQGNRLPNVIFEGIDELHNFALNHSLHCYLSVSKVSKILKYESSDFNILIRKDDS
jgi:3-deoxy-D-arabino-heptulosonate 7-phosphate (DAHP) synthase